MSEKCIHLIILKIIIFLKIQNPYLFTMYQQFLKLTLKDIMVLKTTKLYEYEYLCLLLLNLLMHQRLHQNNIHQLKFPFLILYIV